MVTVYIIYSELTKFQSKAKILDILVCLGDLIIGNGVIILLLLGVKNAGPSAGLPSLQWVVGKRSYGCLAAQ